MQRRLVLEKIGGREEKKRKGKMQTLGVSRRACQHTSVWRSLISDGCEPQRMPAQRREDRAVKIRVHHGPVWEGFGVSYERTASALPPSTGQKTVFHP